MNDKLQYNTQPDQNDFVLRSKEMSLQAGWLGRIFGAKHNAPLNIAGLAVLLLVGSGVLVLFCQSAIPASEYWKIIVPLVTLVMGYIFGKGSKE